MALSLKDLQKGQATKPPLLIVYGGEGLGKTSLAASLPGSVFIPTEDGLTGKNQFIKNAVSFPLATSIEMVYESLSSLWHEEHDFKTVNLDSLDWTEKLIWRKVCKDAGVDSIEKIGYAKGYKFALDEWAKLLDAFTVLRDKRNMMVCMTAHSNISKFMPPNGEPYNRYAMKLYSGAASAVDFVKEWADAVLFINYKTIEKKVDAGFGNTINQSDVLLDKEGNALRSLFTQERPFFSAKNRYDLPFEIDVPFDNPSQPLLSAIFSNAVQPELPVENNNKPWTEEHKVILTEEKQEEVANG